MITIGNAENVDYNGDTERYMFILFLLTNENGEIYNAVWNGWDTIEKRLLYFNSSIHPSKDAINLTDTRGITFSMVYDIIPDDKEAYTVSATEIYEAFSSGELDVERMLVEFLL